MNCKNCGSQLSDGARFCSVCGQKTEQPKEQKNNKTLLVVIISIASAFLIALIVFGILILGKLGDKGSDDSDLDNSKTEEYADLDDRGEKEAAFPKQIANISQEPKQEELPEESDDNLMADDTEEYLAEKFAVIRSKYVTPADDTTTWIPIDDDMRAKLNALDNDYNKVGWAVEYAFRALPSLIMSITVNDNCGIPYAFCAFTNIGDKPVSLDGTIHINDAHHDDDRMNDTSMSEGYPYTGMLQPGGTYMCAIAVPELELDNFGIGYTDLNINFPEAKWGEYSAKGTLGESTGADTANASIIASVSLKNTGDSKVNIGQVTVLLLDEHGLPVANGYVFSATSTDIDGTMDSDISMGILGEDIDKIKDIAIFASPYITG